jgi:transposase InsO family protein
VRADGRETDDAARNRKKSLALAGWNVEQKRQAAMSLRAQAYPVADICAVVGLARSTFYHRPQAQSDAGLGEALTTLAGEYPTYGYRRVTALVQRQGWRVNHKRIQRLMQQRGLQRPLRQRKRRTTNSDHPFPRYPNLMREASAKHPDAIWVADITYVRLKRDFVYLAVLMDGFTRAVRGWHLSRSLDRHLTLTALRQALVDHVPDIHHSDQGWQYACGEYTDLLKASDVQISMAAVGKPEENGFAERLMRTIKEEAIDLSEYTDFHDAYQRLGRFLEDVYTRKRIHSALGYLTPAEFEAQWHAQQQRALVS